jgi:hypothetical protein
MLPWAAANPAYGSRPSRNHQMQCISTVRQRCHGHMTGINAIEKQLVSRVLRNAGKGLSWYSHLITGFRTIARNHDYRKIVIYWQSFSEEYIFAHALADPLCTTPSEYGKQFARPSI